MGINTHFYTVYGVYLDEFDESLNERYKDLYDEIGKAGDIDIIIDGMGGDYMIFGKILFNSGDQRWGDVYDAFKIIDLDSLDDHKRIVTEAFIKYFPDHVDIINQEWKLMTLMHLT